MSNTPTNLSGLEKAAIFLLALGEKSAASVLQHVGPKVVQRIGAAMTRIGTVSVDQVQMVMTEFGGFMQNQTSLGLGADDFIRRVLVQAVGEDKATSLLERILSGSNSKGLETLKWIDTKAIYELIRHEHPQIVALVLAYLDADQSAEVLVMFPDRERSDLIMRLATLESIQPAALRELNDIMEKQFSGNAGMQKSELGGVKSAANLMNFLESAVEGDIIDAIKERDAELAQKIQDLMFVFENLVELDDRSMQLLLREVNSEILILALKGADENLREKIFSNMSKRAGEMLRDDLEAKGPVRLSDVEGAQKEILAAARRLADAGEIALGGKGEEYV